MSQLSKILRDTEGGGIMFKCPACKEAHRVVVNTTEWHWNGNAEKPTITPSILVRSEANPDAVEAFKEWRTERRCHSFVTDGKIQFLSDCTHELAGQTVDIPDWSPSC